MSNTKKKTEEPTPEAKSDTADPKNVYEYQVSSTETATITPDEYWRIKLAI